MSVSETIWRLTEESNKEASAKLSRQIEAEQKVQSLEIEVERLLREIESLRGENEQLTSTLGKATARNRQLEEHYTKLREYVIAHMSES